MKLELKKTLGLIGSTMNIIKSFIGCSALVLASLPAYGETPVTLFFNEMDRFVVIYEKMNDCPKTRSLAMGRVGSSLSGGRRIVEGAMEWLAFSEEEREKEREKVRKFSLSPEGQAALAIGLVKTSKIIEELEQALPTCNK